MFSNRTPAPAPIGTVELDDEQLSQIAGGTTIPCAVGGGIVASIEWCTNDTVIWGSCRLGTRGCC